jgi:D-alanyl-D-alanine carboxypeptidase (penicillin-binding protein 5/6)
MALYVLLPVLVIAFIVVVRKNLQPPDAPDPQHPPKTAPQPDGRAPGADAADDEPERDPPAPAMRGLDAYRHAGLTLPPTLKQRLPEHGSGILVAPELKLILWSYRDREPVPIASMTKMMSLLLVAETVNRRDDVDYDTVTTVSRRAEAVGGSQIWLMAGHRYPLHKLCRAAAVKSANDAMFAAAEAVAPGGDNGRFVALMNRRARRLGMRYARFYNVHGLPTPRGRPDNRASCRGLVLLAVELRRHERVCTWLQTKTSEFVHGNDKVVKIRNTNHDLLTRCPGVDGMKTGYTRKAGFCVTASCRRDGRRLLAIGTGFPDKDRRFLFISGLFAFGFERLPQVLPATAP